MTEDPRRNAILNRMRESPGDPLAFIPVAPLRNEAKEQRNAKRKAKRQAYDKAYPITSFFIPEHLHETARVVKKAMRRIAFENLSTEAMVSLAFVKWSLGKVRSGELVLEGRADASRRKMAVVLMDADMTSWPKPQEFPEYQRTKKEKPMRMGWRWPAEIKTQLNGLATDAMPVGEVTVLLLDYALKACRSGNALIATQSMDFRQGTILKDR